MNIKIYSDGKEIKWSWFKFSAGEIQVKITNNIVNKNTFSFVCKEYSADGIMTCLLLRNAIINMVNEERTYFNLFLPYLPYSRQDRVCAKGEAFSLSVFISQIFMVFDSIQTVDVHNPKKCPIENISLYEQMDYEHRLVIDDLLYAGGFHLVSPDEGAKERVKQLADDFCLSTEIIQGIKKRDPGTGQLSGFDYVGDVEGKKLLIVDDLCDGGGTFIGLAQKLLEGGAKEVRLLVTHGIFSKGVDVLIDNGISHVYTTNTYYEEPWGEIQNNLTIFDII